MKTIIFILITLVTVCTMAGCTKIEENNPSVVPDDEILIAVEHSIYSVDSIFYENDFIKNISTYKKSNGDLILNESYILERFGSQVKVQTGDEMLDLSILSFNGPKISEIRSMDENFKAEFHYKDELVDYLLYTRGEYHDSLSFFYNRNKENITRMEWYTLNSGVSSMFFTADFTFDDKRNPFNKSIYWLVMNWKGPNDIVQYFNSNNILGIGSHKLYYRYNENDYPMYRDIAYYGRTTYSYQTW